MFNCPVEENIEVTDKKASTFLHCYTKNNMKYEIILSIARDNIAIVHYEI